MTQVYTKTSDLNLGNLLPFVREGYNFFKAQRLLNGRDQKKIGNNTWAIKNEDGSISIRLHQTNILTFRSDNTCVYQTNGWQTSTTKNRINEYAPVPVYQKDYQWYFWGGEKYVDGIIVRCK